jgi:hypothetical protein
VEAAEKALVLLRSGHSESEAGIWKAKKKGEQEVEVALREYDTEVAERHQELVQEQAAYYDLCARMKVCTTAAANTGTRLHIGIASCDWTHSHKTQVLDPRLGESRRWGLVGSWSSHRPHRYGVLT